MSAIVPVPRCEVAIRPATMEDVAFIDKLRDLHRKSMGFMPLGELEGKINAGHALIAEDDAGASIGYCIAQDKYMKREEVGVIYALNVMPMKQRNLVGASLIKAAF